MIRQLNVATILITALAASPSIRAESAPETAFSLAKTARVPGATLKPGNYTIQILDRLADRYILEIRNSKNSAPLATFLAIPDGALAHSSSGTPIYWPKSGRTPALRGMWISGAPTAAVFVFPKADAAKLAQQVGQPIPAVDPDSEGKAEVTKMNDSDRQIVTLWLLSAVAITPEGEKTGIQAAKFVPSEEVSAAMARKGKATPPTLVAKAERPVPARMPKTASTSGNNLLAGLILISMGTLLAKSYGSRIPTRRA